LRHVEVVDKHAHLNALLCEERTGSE
jgi:hypothetical protein